jgi:hypothetical protein
MYLICKMQERVDTVRYTTDYILLLSQPHHYIHTLYTHYTTTRFSLSLYTGLLLLLTSRSRFLLDLFFPLLSLSLSASASAVDPDVL